MKKIDYNEKEGNWDFDKLKKVFAQTRYNKKFVTNNKLIKATSTPGETLLTLPTPIPDKERKLSYIFIFTLLCGASKNFMKGLKAFIKPSEAPHISGKIKI